MKAKVGDTLIFQSGKHLKIIKTDCWLDDIFYEFGLLDIEKWEVHTYVLSLEDALTFAERKIGNYRLVSQ